MPFSPGGARESTLKAWWAQGLNKNEYYLDALRRELGLPPEEITPKTIPETNPGINFRMLPIFEEKVLEHINGHYIVQDWMGNITEISDEYDVSYIRHTRDFVTRKWHKFPVENREDFEAMKKRYNPHEPGRYPEDFAERCKAMRDRDYLTSICFSGPFWQLREWCGFEPLCMLFIEDPDFIREMIAFWTDYVSKTMARVLDAGVLDRLAISEDMAYKEKSMISPAMTREFLQSSYDRWIKEARQAGVAVIDMDSDGRLDELIPIWIESGFDLCDPIEVAAGCDIAAYRQTFGKKIAYQGGVDKRCMAKGGRIIEDEIARIAPVVRDGGYIPSCDHGVPPDISWPNFIHYGRLLAEVTGWL